ncbi:type II toxin-antitoxin system toxin DNA ADP-ribosyl transferase DarT [Oceanobacillus alkalisoli]|uniref:type II toxin-antitoxin system toxin DNA ADP-ribosyl transferase DarT n=1 Tax=Oceanobacillus alkalisoli TaxID=2925113 RepID=UPI001EE4AD17|nr:DUF4433 domain-containing protein [Oceanobacillus alkalisoli]MCG5102555.1 DUF4433 domain-containing protein [Oceanobacillus alkalisoli]
MPKSKLLYHITHINNLESIFRQDSLLPHAHIKKCIINYKDVANQDIQSRRERTIIPVGAGGYLHDYVPFYFAPRSPMLYVLKMQPIPQDDIVYFMTNIESIQQHSLSYVFTDAHAIRRLTNFYTNLENISQIDWDVMQASVWTDTDDDPNRKARRQAEFLVHKEVPLSACLGFAVYSDQTKQRVKEMLKIAGLTVPVAVRRHFYF